MKNKKFLCLVLALVMVLGAFGPVFAETKAADDKKDEKKADVVTVEKVEGRDKKIQWLVDHEIVIGRKVNEDPKNNDLALDKTIQRAEITKLLVYAIGRQDLAEKLQSAPTGYKDFEPGYWANGVITVGTTQPSPVNSLGFIQGYEDHTFQPKKDVTYAELAKMLVVLVKSDLTKDMHDKAKWPTDWLAWAAKLGIFEDVKYADANKAAVRSDAFVMMYNALYRLKDLRKLPANETLGIISAARGNKLTLNQGDFKKEFTVDAKTNFVTALKTPIAEKAKDKIIFWSDVVRFDDTYYLGSLVRVLTDEKGVVTHIVQLGNPVNHVLNNDAWKPYAQKTVETVAEEPINNVNTAIPKSVYNYVVLGDKTITFTTDATKTTAKQELVLNLNEKTRFFVADTRGVVRQLTEVKNKAAAYDMIKRGTVNVKDVYAGYDVLENTKFNEAKIVVFNTVDKGTAVGKVVRVETPGNAKYDLNVVNSGVSYAEAKKEVISLRDYKAAFPFDYNFEKYDVIEMIQVDGGLFATHAIDHDKDNVYQVKSVETRRLDGLKTVPAGYVLELTLTDGKGEAKVDVVVDADYFFANELKKDEFVQVRFAKNAEEKLINRVDIISVVPDTKVRGELPAELKVKDLRTVTGVVESKERGEANGLKLFTVKANNSNYSGSYVAATKALAEVKEGDRITFKTDAATKYAPYNVPLATEINNHTADARNVKTLIKDLPDTVTKADLKKVDEAKAAYDALEKPEKDLITDAEKAKLDKAVEQAQAIRDAQKAYDEYVAKVKALKVELKDNTPAADAKTAVEKAIATVGQPADGVTVTVDQPAGPITATDNKVKVTLTSDNAEVTNQSQFDFVVTVTK